MTYVFTSWHTFDAMTYFMASGYTFWRYDVLSIVSDVMTYFLTSWRTFWNHDILSIVCDVMTYFWCYDVFFDVMTPWCTVVITCFDSMHFLTLWHTSWRHDVIWTLRRIFWCHHLLFDSNTYFTYFWRYNILFDVMTYLLISWHTFHIFNIVTNFDGMMYILMSWHTFSRYGIVYDIYFLTYMFWRHDVHYIRFDVFTYFLILRSLKMWKSRNNLDDSGTEHRTNARLVPQYS